MNIAIIPARGGSQRIPHKNIKEFLGQPIINYSIQAAKGSGVFDEIVVSTEDQEIADVAKAAGANIPFMRPKELADDDVPMYEVVRFTLAELSKQNHHFENCCMIYATAPMISGDYIRLALDTMIAEAADVCIPVVRSPWHFQRAMIIEDGRLRMVFPGQKDKTSNLWFDTYHHAEMFWWMSIPRLMMNGNLFPPKAAPFIVDWQSVFPIDTPEDWTDAENRFIDHFKKTWEGRTNGNH